MKTQFEPVNCRFGAPMGRAHYCDWRSDETEKLSLFRVNMVDGDYDDGGAYWGGYPSAPLYCARTVGHDEVQLFYRAHSREDAKAQALKEHPGLKFMR